VLFAGWASELAQVLDASEQGAARIVNIAPIILALAAK
jgi:hypothetical protein